jgi:hypothetical protein
MREKINTIISVFHNELIFIAAVSIFVFIYHMGDITVYIIANHEYDEIGIFDK